MCKKERKPVTLDWVSYNSLVSRDTPLTKAEQKVLLLGSLQLLGKQLFTELT